MAEASVVTVNRERLDYGVDSFPRGWQICFLLKTGQTSRG